MAKHSLLEIDSYLFFWESYYRANTLVDFEKNYIASFFEKNAKGTEAKIQLIDALRKFYLKHGVEAYIQTQKNSLEIKKTIIKKETNIYEKFFSKILSIKIGDLIEMGEHSNISKIELSSLDALSNECFGDQLEALKALDVYRNSLRKTLKLEQRDALFVLGEKIAIKYFKKSLDNPSEKRFNGVEIDELKRLCEKYKKFNYPHLIERITFNVITKALDLKNIDNITFSRNYIKLIQSQLQKAFKKFIPNEVYLVGFTNYLLRDNFNQALKIIINGIISLVGKNCENIKIFINFYDGGDIVIGTKKYKKPEIVVDNQRMSFYPIYTIINQYNSLENSYKNRCNDIENLNSELMKKRKSVTKLKSIIEDDRYSLEKIDKDSQSSASELRDLRNEYQELQKNQKSVMNKSKKGEFEEQIIALKEKIKKWSLDDSELLSMKNRLSSDLEKSMIKYEEIKKDIVAISSNIDRESEKLNDTSDALLELEKKVSSIREGIKDAILKFRI